MDVFVYGTLTDPTRASAVVADARFLGPATLSGLHRVDGAYPTLVPGGETEGRLLRTDDVAALDAYEGTDRGLYVRVTVPRTDGGTVETYVGDPDALDADADAAWPGAGPFPDRVRRYLAAADVTVAAE